MRILSSLMLIAALFFSVASQAESVGTSFTYQGELQQSGVPANGNFDFQFELYDTESGGVTLSTPVLRESIAVQDGVFQVDLDFGLSPFSGDQLWLEIRIKRTGVSGTIILEPRQKLTATPFAIKSLGVTQGSITSQEIDTSSVQARVVGACAADSSMRAISANGSVTCETDTDTVLSEGEVDAFVANNGYSTGAHTVDTTLSEGEVDAFVANNDYATISTGDSRWGQHPITVTNGASAANYMGNSISSCNTHNDHRVSITVPAAGTILLSGQAWIRWHHTTGITDQMVLYFTSLTSGCTDSNVGGWDEMWVKDIPGSYPTHTSSYDMANLQRTVTVPSAGTYTYYLGGFMASGFTDETERFWWANIVATWHPN